jgi:hypothetical protein
MDLFKANNQWSTRPADERFGSCRRHKMKKLLVLILLLLVAGCGKNPAGPSTLILEPTPVPTPTLRSKIQENIERRLPIKIKERVERETKNEI